MKLAHLLPKLRSQLGFTMIELLVVIAVIGVLAVAVLSSINPIEQINKGRDTRVRSDAAQLINAVDRYYALQEEYPWNTARVADDEGPAYTVVEPLAIEDFVQGGIDQGTGENTSEEDDWGWLYHLTDASEVKEGYVNRVINDNKIVIFKPFGSNATMYACFLPTSDGLKKEALDNCVDGITPGSSGSTETTTVTTCPGEATNDEDLFNLICLP